MKRILALDYGDKKIGVALSDPTQVIAKPLKIIYNSPKVIDELIKIINEFNIEKIVVGLPITLKNKKSIQTEKTIKFIEMIRKDLEIPIIEYDERLTSQIATQSLILQGVKTGYNKTEIDKTAAAIFLQNYLDDPSK